MNKDEIKKMTYTEVVARLDEKVDGIDKKVDSLDTKFNALDARELLLQKEWARLMGKLEGEKKAKEEAKEEESEQFKRDWTKIGTALALIGLIVQFIYWLWERWPK